VRILDEEGRLHYPNEFIEQLEHSHYLSEFKDWALKEVYEKIEKWGKPISINISTRTFRDESFPERLIEYARRASSEIIIEITERLYMEDPQRAEEVIQTLKKCKNIRVAIDDFGTGYSSLSYLRQISADILKVDISFVRAMLEDERSRAIVETIVRLAKALGMRTLAEGVEREEQREMLVEMGVDYLQGFLLAKPMPEDKVEELL
jgi:EAL domain-containing protein (putative c-di-GMP-specific phosphodiesterase class I)